MGIEPTAIGLKGQRSTIWAKKATRKRCLHFKFTIKEPKQMFVQFFPTNRSAFVAQLGERQTEDLKVPGSIPGEGIFLIVYWGKFFDWLTEEKKSLCSKKRAKALFL